MKIFFKILLLPLLLSAVSLRSDAQTQLTIQSILNFPDTAYNGLTVHPVIIVKNTGNAIYQGTIQIGIRVNNTNVGYLYYDTIPHILAPSDTISFGGPGTIISYTFDSSVYRVNNNVVVVWPISSAAIIDTFHTNVYFTTSLLSGLHENTGITGLEWYPNPAKDFIQLFSPEIKLEYVRIFDVSGRSVMNLPLEKENETKIPVEALQPGIYFIEAEAINKSKSLLRFVKVNE